MDTSAEQLHHSKLQTAARNQERRLFVDLDRCATGECAQCRIQCSYWHHPANNGIVSVAELATYALVCRRCQEPHCVNACPYQALEQNREKDRILVRHNMRCVSCKSCSHACPYGTIYPENVPLLVHNCDFCLDRRTDTKEPLCITTCPHGALALRGSDEPLEENTFLVGENLIIHSTHWMREKV